MIEQKLSQQSIGYFNRCLISKAIIKQKRINKTEEKKMGETAKERHLYVVFYLFVAIVTLSPATLPGQQSSDKTEQNQTTQQLSFIKDGRLDLEAAVKHFEDMYRSNSSISDVELKITRPRSERTLDMKVWTKGQEKVLIVIQSPPREKDTATLKVDNNLWYYLPRINRTIRIPASMMLTSWMGSDFTNDDLVRESSFSQDYTYKLTGHSEDPAGWQVDFIAKPDVVGLWSRFELIVSEDGTIPIQAKYFDRKDRHARTISWQDVKNFDGHIIPSKMTLVPEDEEGNKTEMIYTDIDFDAMVPDDTFSLSQLERKR